MIDHTQTVADVKALLLSQGFDLSGPCGAFQITRRVAWLLKLEGWGLIHSGGNGCVVDGEKYRADTIMLRDGTTIDLLQRSESDNGDTSNPANYNIPIWSITGSQSPDNWREPLDPGGLPSPLPVPGPTPIPTPQPTGCNCKEEISGLRAQLDTLQSSVNETKDLLKKVSTRVDQSHPDYGGSILGYRVSLKPSNQ